MEIKMKKNENKTMSKNGNLHQAKNAKNDEFYTMLSDIEKELRHYKDYFKGKRVYCNCDDPFESNFFKYFVLNFNALGLKSLTTTCYNGSKVSGRELSLFEEDEVPARKAYHITIGKVEDLNGDGAIDLEDIKLLLKSDGNCIKVLNGNGDFRSDECVEELKNADIVVTNPPFSLFREYIKQLMDYDKKFLVVGNPNAVTYKEVFPLIKENKVWLGISPRSMNFIKPDGCVENVNACWFTNLHHGRRNEMLTLYKRYNEREYPKYDNYDAIEVSKVCEIPMDYEGVMGVPITFIDKYNPQQFEILGIQQRTNDPYKIKHYTKEEYDNASDLNARGVIMIDGKPKSTYPRLLIRHRLTRQERSELYGFEA